LRRLVHRLRSFSGVPALLSSATTATQSWVNATLPAVSGLLPWSGGARGGRLRLLAHILSKTTPFAVNGHPAARFESLSQGTGRDGHALPARREQAAAAAGHDGPRGWPQPPAG